MSFSRVRSIFDYVGRGRRGNPWSAPQPRDESMSAMSDSSSVISASTQPSVVSDDSDPDQIMKKPVSDQEMLTRAHELHATIDFDSLAAGPGKGGPWERVEVVDRFVIFRGQDAKLGVTADGVEVERSPEVMCAGRLDASIEEVASVLRSTTEAQHNAAMTGFYDKKFIFGSLERTVPCAVEADNNNNDDASEGGNGESLTVKTSSFARTGLFGCNEQWCYIDYFQRKCSRDGFTISQHSLDRNEATPGRIAGTQNRVEQLHDLTAAYLVDLDPGNKGLRVVFSAKFSSPEQPKLSIRDFSMSSQSSSWSLKSSSSSASTDRYSELKAQNRRLLAIAHGVTKLPEIVRRRRFGFQIPVNQDAIQVANQRCPCCTCSLAPVKMSLSAAASAISSRTLAPLRMDTRRCYLCGYLVCINCWSTDRMENASGRVAGIIVCRRCHANVATPPENPTASLLVDYLAASLDHAPADSPERSNVLAVVRTLLRHSEDPHDEEEELCLDQHEEMDAMSKVEEFLADERNFPPLETCSLGNTESRDYVIDWPEDEDNKLPVGPIPGNEGPRISAAKATGLIDLANKLAPVDPADRDPEPDVNVKDLELICSMAMETIGFTNSLVTVMGASHEHILAATSPAFAGLAMPRNETLCQYQIMSPGPMMLVHPEADVRFHTIPTIQNTGLKTYVGFPVTAPTDSGEEVAVGTLCCYSLEPHPELTQSQYSAMQNLARTASQLMQQKGLEVKNRAAPA